MSNNKSWMSEAYSEMRKADTIEPTEEQKEAVRTWCTRELATTYGWHPIAQFLAEREAKLRAVCTVQALQMARSVEDETAAEIDTLREENRILRAQWLARNEENQAELAECEDTEEGDNELAEREAKLREEVYAQAWNLGGISVLATSRTMQDYDQTMARPALNEVAALLKDYDTLRARVAELEAREKFRDLAAEVDTGEPVDVLLMRTLSARVAELEAKIADAVFSCPGCGRHDFGFFASQIKAACGPCRTRAEVAEAREAQHLADIKALMGVLDDLLNDPNDIGEEEARDRAEALYTRLAHYDDARCPGFGAKDCDGSCALTEAEREALDDAKVDAPVSAEGGEG